MFHSPSRSKIFNLERTIIRPIKEVAPRSSIRGFRDDYYRVGTDVVLVEGEIHLLVNTVSIAPYFRSLTCVHVKANSHLISPFR